MLISSIWFATDMPNLRTYSLWPYPRSYHGSVSDVLFVEREGKDLERALNGIKAGIGPLRGELDHVTRRICEIGLNSKGHYWGHHIYL